MDMLQWKLVALVNFRHLTAAPLQKKGENKGNLRKVGVTKNECTPRKREMCKIHRNISSRMCKLKKSLEKEQKQVKSIKKMLEANIFDIIENKLNDVTKDFIKSQLRNADKTNYGRRWTVEDKAFALTIYKRSPPCI
jgi:hypothetical protein